MKFQFSKSSQSDPAAKFLREIGCAFEKQADGTLVVPGNLDLSDRKLTVLPDLSSVRVMGNFHVPRNQLTSLEGAPQWVGGNVSCVGNHLTTLEGAPKFVGGWFSCDSNQLTDLAGGPQSVGGDFSCVNNRLTSLRGAPESVGGNFSCDSNALTSLEHAPQNVGGTISCTRNRLTDLTGAPSTFKALVSDFGRFSPTDIPAHLRPVDETNSRNQDAELAALASAAVSQTISKRPLRDDTAPQPGQIKTLEIKAHPEPGWNAGKKRNTPAPNIPVPKLKQ